MAPAQPSSSPPPSLWRSSLAAALRRIARAIAPPQAASRVSVTQPAERAAQSPQLPPPQDHASGNDASQPTVVDPLERARAALRDARQHMTALMTSEPPAAAAPAPFAPGEHRVEPLHELLTELRNERRALLEEMGGLRALLQETRAEVAALRQALRDRAAEVQALQQPPIAAEEPPLAPPAPSLSELIADAGEAPAGHRDAEVASAPVESSDTAAAPSPPEPASERLPAPKPDLAPFRDFGWRLRPEAYPFDATQAAPAAGSPSETPAAKAVAPPEQASPPDAPPDDLPAGPPAVAEAVAEIEASTADLADAGAASAEAGEADSVLVAHRVSDFAPYETPYVEGDAGHPNALEAAQPAAPAADEGAAVPEPDINTAQAGVAEAMGAATLEHASLLAGDPATGGEPAAPAAEAQEEMASGGEGDGRGEEAGPEAEAIRLPAGSTRLVIGPVRSIGRLTALERRLVREPALAQVTLADFRRQLATIVVSARAPIAFAALAPALADEERHPLAAAWQEDGSLLVTLGKRAEEGA